MSDFEERLKAAISQGQQKVGEQKRLDQEFAAGWAAARPLIHETVKAANQTLRTIFGNVLCKNDNGGTVVWLAWSHQADSPDFRLEFKPNAGARKIVCKSSPSGLLDDETFSPEHLDRAVVESKIVALVDAIFDAAAGKKRPAAGAVGAFYG